MNNINLNINENDAFFTILLDNIKSSLFKEYNGELFRLNYYKIDLNYSEDVKILNDVLNKNINDITLEDINDLLVTFTADEFTDGISLYEFVRNNELRLVYNSFNCSFDLNIFIKYWLICNSDIDVTMELFKDYSKDFKLSNINEKFMKYNGLGKIKNFCDLYNTLLEIQNDSDIESKKEKIIAIMSNVPEQILVYVLNDLDITYEDLNVFFNVDFEKETYGDKFNVFIKETINALSNAKKINGQTKQKDIKMKKLKDKVNKEYLEYVNQNDFVTYDDFINYYNEKFCEDDFSCFYYMEQFVQFKGLTRDIFLFCRKYEGKFDEYREFLYTCDALEEEKKEQMNFVNNTFKKKQKHVSYLEVVLTKYSHFLEELKGDIEYTLDGFIYKNIPDVDRFAFRYVVSFYTGIDGKYFGKNHNKSSVVQKENTLNLLFKEFEEMAILNPEMFEELSVKYYEKIVFCINRSYIKVNEWKKMTDLVLNKIKANNFINLLKPMIEVVKNNESLVEYYISLNLEESIYDNCNYLLVNYPECKNAVDILLDYYNNEIALINLKNEELLRMREQETFKIALNEAISIVSDFVEGDYKSKEAYLDDNEISNSKFNKALNLVLENNSDLYLGYISKLNGLKTKRFMAIKMHVNKILQFIVNGIEENGFVRPFNILDYNLMTRMSLDEFYHFVKSSNLLNSTNARCFKEFYNSNSNNIRITKESILNEEYSILENGVRRFVTDSEKEIAFDYMKKHHLNSVYSIYVLVLRKVITGQIKREYSNEELKGKRLGN